MSCHTLTQSRQIVAKTPRKGIATYCKAKTFEHVEDFIRNEMQISKFTSDTLDVLAVYRSSKGHTVELLQQIKQMINPEKAKMHLSYKQPLNDFDAKIGTQTR